jgi:hypothetical protein
MIAKERVRRVGGEVFMAAVLRRACVGEDLILIETLTEWNGSGPRLQCEMGFHV